MQIATITTFPGPLKNIAAALERGYRKKEEIIKTTKSWETSITN